MSRPALRGVLSGTWRLLLAIIFYPIAFGLMIWLTLKGHHWGWGVGVIAAVLILDPIYRIIFKSIVSWRPAKTPDLKK